MPLYNSVKKDGIGAIYSISYGCCVIVFKNPVENTFTMLLLAREIDKLTCELSYPRKAVKLFAGYVKWVKGLNIEFSVHFRWTEKNPFLYNVLCWIYIWIYIKGFGMTKITIDVGGRGSED